MSKRSRAQRRKKQHQSSLTAEQDTTIRKPKAHEPSPHQTTEQGSTGRWRGRSRSLVRGGSVSERAKTPLDSIYLTDAQKAIKGKEGQTRKTSDKLPHTEGYIISQDAAPSYVRNMNLQALDIYALTLKDPYDLLMEIADSSPDLSRVIWDFLRLINCGWTARAYRENDKDYPKAQKALDAFLNRIKDYHGSVNVPINRFMIGAGIYGGFFGELLLNENATMAVDILAVDPSVVRFKRVRDPLRGLIWQLGQYSDLGQWVDLNVPTVKYIPIDPMPNSPFGRSIWVAGLYPALFILGMLYDLRRIIAQQGYPRMDISIDMKAVFAGLPAEIQAELANDIDAYLDWHDSILQGTAQAIDALKPDATFVHTSDSTVNKPASAGADNLRALENVISAIERICVRGFKTMTFLQNVNANVDAQTSNRQWEVYTKGLQAMQNILKELLEVFCTLALRAEGIAAKVVWEFETVRMAEMLRDEEVFGAKITNANAAYEAGYFSQEQASYHAVGGKPDTPEPRSKTEAKEAAAQAEKIALAQAEAASNQPDTSVSSGGGTGSEAGDEEDSTQNSNTEDL